MRRLTPSAAITATAALLLTVTAVTGCSGGSSDGASSASSSAAAPRVNPGWEPKETAPGFTLASTDFTAGGEFPRSIELGSYGCSGPNTRPELHWSGAPEGTKSFVVTFTAEGGGPLERWMAFDVPADATSLPAAPGDEHPKAGRIGSTPSGGTVMLGPCSKEGERWELWFTVYALDTTLDLADESPVAEVFAAGAGHVLAAAELNGFHSYQEA